MIPPWEFESLTPQLTVYRCGETLYIIPHAQCRMRKHQAESIQMCFEREFPWRGNQLTIE